MKNPPAMWDTWVRCGTPGFDPWVRKSPWRRAGQPTPVFLPGQSHKQKRLAGYSPWGSKESDVAEQLRTHTVMDRETHFST